MSLPGRLPMLKHIKDNLFVGLNLKELSQKLQKRILEAGVGQSDPCSSGME